jgi:branched-chain amino acid transport system substrate-binding protein
MRQLGVQRVYVLDDQDAFDVPLAAIVAQDAASGGITVVGRDSLPTPAGAVFSGEIEKIVQSRAQAVFFAGGDGAGAIALWRQLHAADPRLLLLGPSGLAGDAFTSQIGAAGASTYLTTPVLPPSMYSASSRRVLSDYRRQFGGAAGAYALYGYEAMSVVLEAIRGAGARGNDRRVVTERFFATRNRDSVIGRYSVAADGETTLSRFAVDRVLGGHAVFLRATGSR